jgi:hypothetical protein
MLLYDTPYETLQSVLAHPDHVVIFYHLHKTAGTTVENALKAEYGAAALKCHTPADRLAVLEAFRGGRLPRGRRVIYGHNAWAMRGDMEALGYRPGVNLFRFTFTRHPVDRLESWQAFLKMRDPEARHTMQQFATRYRKYALSTYFDIKVALDWLKGEVDFVGVCESFDRSAALLFQMLGIPALEVKSYNVNKGPKDRLPMALVPGFISRYRMDFLIYEMARASLDQACEAHLEREPVNASQIATLARATQTNHDLDKNQDPYSLLMTGIEIHATDRPRARAFFEKALKLNIRFAARVAKFLKARDKAMLADLCAHFTATAPADPETRSHIALLG